MTFISRAPVARAVTTATILGLALIAAPSTAHALDLAPGAAAGLPLVLAQYGATPAAPAAATAKQSPADANPAAAHRVEARIKDLHDKLHLTPAQSAQWEPVAQSMRASAAIMTDSIRARSAKTKSMTAMDDLRSYQRVTQAHIDGLNQFIPAFAALYDGMSPAQQKNADVVFTRSQRHPAAPEKSKTSSQIN